MMFYNQDMSFAARARIAFGNRRSKARLALVVKLTVVSSNPKYWISRHKKNSLVESFEKLVVHSAGFELTTF